MFRIEYEIITASFDNLESLTEEELRYNFLLGNVMFKTDQDIINMDWEWIPLLDFSLCLYEINKKLSNRESLIQVFEFTESAEIIEFLNTADNLKISPSFSSNNIEIPINEFDSGVRNFYYKIGLLIKEKTANKVVSTALNKYLTFLQA